MYSSEQSEKNKNMYIVWPLCVCVYVGVFLCECVRAGVLALLNIDCCYLLIRICLR